MADLDVALRLRLVDRLSGPARKTADALKGIDRAATGLGRTGGGDRLGRSLRDMDAAARRAGSGLATVDRNARSLQRVDPGRRIAEGLRRSSTAANTLTSRLSRTRTEARQLAAMPMASGNFARSLSTLEQRVTRLKNELAAAKREAGGLGRADVSGSGGGGAGPDGEGNNVLARSGGWLVSVLAGLPVVRQVRDGIDGFQTTMRTAAGVAATAEMYSTDVIKRIMKSDAALGTRYGLPQANIGGARQVYTAAGFGLDQQEQILSQTVMASKASSLSVASSPEVFAQAAVAAIENLKVPSENIGQVFDMIAKGTKLGRFEPEALAQYLPMLGAQYAGLGGTGIQSLAEIIAFAEVVRQGAGDQASAATNLQNLFAKITAPDTVKRFEEKGVNLERVINGARKQGIHPAFAILDEAQRLTGGDEFRLGELFGDMQVKQALRPLMENRALLTEWLKAIRDDSAGTVQRDYDLVAATPAEQSARDVARREVASNRLGEYLDPAWRASWGAITAFVESFPDGIDRLRGLVPDGLASRARVNAGGPLSVGDAVSALNTTNVAQILGLAFAKAVGPAASDSASSPPRPSASDLVKTSGRGKLQSLMNQRDRWTTVQDILESSDKPELQLQVPQARMQVGRLSTEIQALADKLQVDLSQAGQQGGNALRDGLAATGPGAVSVMIGIMEQLKALGNITITPQIVPQLRGSGATLPGVGAPAAGGIPKAEPMSLPAAPAAPSSRQAATGGGPRQASVNVGGIHINGASSPQSTARAVERQLARLSAPSNALYDTV